MFLAGDLGGTKTALALFTNSGGPREPIAETVYPSREHHSLEAIVGSFLASHQARLAADPIAAAAFGVAGPVFSRTAKITNLAWTVDQESLAQLLQLDMGRVALLNDLEAVACAIPELLESDLQSLNVGQSVEHAPIAVLAPGTGLGQAYLTWDGHNYRAHASEGGHVDFAPCNQLQLELLNYLYQRYEHVSFERVISGMGIPEMYRFLRDSGRATEPPQLAQALSQAEDWAPIIVSQAAQWEICQQTVEMFVAILAAKAGNVALALMSRGGVYLGGGIPPRILPFLQSDIFLHAFRSKGRFSAFVSDVPVHVIMNPKAGLLGTAYAALKLVAAPG